MRLAPVFVAMLLAATALRVPIATQQPVHSTSPAVVHGSVLFKEYCASCHGTDGRGGGVAAPAMRFMPPDLTTLAAHNNGVFPAERMKQVIAGYGPAAHGDRLMPVWGDVFTRTSDPEGARTAIDDMVRYLEWIQRRSA